MNDKKIIIYSDDVCEYVQNYKSDICEYLKENDTPINDNNIFDEAQNNINAYYEDIKNTLSAYDNNNNYKSILVVACLGLWYGKRQAQKHFNSLYNAVLYCFEDINALYFERKNTTLTLSATHHDGTNIFKFYVIKNGKKYAIKLNDIEVYF